MTFGSNQMPESIAHAFGASWRINPVGGATSKARVHANCTIRSAVPSERRESERDADYGAHSQQARENRGDRDGPRWPADRAGSGFPGLAGSWGGLFARIGFSATGWGSHLL